MTSPLPEREFRPSLHRFQVLVEYLPSALRGATWLDLGGGAGEFSLLATKQGYEVTFVDEDVRNVSKATERGMRAIMADLNRPLTELGTAEFDGVSLIEVVEHIDAAEQLVAEAFRVLKPGGLLLLSTPNAVWWRERARIMAGRPPEAEGYHYRFFTVANARSLCSDAGFQVLSTHFSAPAFGINWFRRRVLKRTNRKHLKVSPRFAGLLAQTVYIVGRKP